MAMEDDALDVEVRALGRSKEANEASFDVLGGADDARTCVRQALASRYAGAAKVRVRAGLVAQERRMVRS